MLKQVTVSDLQRNASGIMEELANGPIIISQRGRPAAVLVDRETFEEIENRLAEAEKAKALEVITAGLRSARAGRTSPHQTVVKRVRAALRRRGGRKKG